MKRCCMFLGLVIFLYIPLKGEENFILMEGNTSRIIREFGPNVYERATPASSFKIVLSLIGYDTGILKDATTPSWDFLKGYDDFLELWKSSQVPQTWMKYSCIWFSKIIALQLGYKKLQQYLNLFDYGNQDLSTGMVKPGPLSPAWVSSSLKISPKEQVDFIRKMILRALPVSSHAFEMTKGILFQEKLSKGWELYGKTGLGTISKKDGKSLCIRWFVGWIERGQTFFPFAYQMRKKEIDIVQTIPRVKQLLKESNIVN